MDKSPAKKRRDIIISTISFVVLFFCLLFLINFFKNLKNEKTNFNDLGEFEVSKLQSDSNSVTLTYQNKTDNKYQISLYSGNNFIDEGKLKGKGEFTFTFNNLALNEPYQIVIKNENETIYETKFRTKDQLEPVLLYDNLLIPYGSNYQYEILKRITIYDNLLGIMDKKDCYLELPLINKPGSYEAKLEIYDNFHNLLKTKVSFKVVSESLKDELQPKVYYSGVLNYDLNVNLVDTLKKEVIVYDNEDGLITDVLFKIPEIKAPGIYDVSLSASDKNKNKLEDSFKVTIKANNNDLYAPQVYAPSKVVSDLYGDFESLIRSEVVIYDNYLGVMNPQDLVLEIPPINKVGLYEVKYEIKDLNNNISTGLISLDVRYRYDSLTIETNDDLIYTDDLSKLNPLETYFTIYDNDFIEVEKEWVKLNNLSITSPFAKLHQGLNTLTCSYLNQSKTLLIYLTNDEFLIYDDKVKSLDPANMESVGDVNVLVIPVAFKGHPKTEEMRNNINKAFFGTPNDTGWQSVKSYYETSSYHKLNYNGVVTPWYEVKEDQNYYATYSDNNNYLNGSTLILNECLDYFKDTYDYNDFDLNQDGYIDAVYMVYNVPIGGNKTPSQDDFYWAYVYWDFNNQFRRYQQTKGNCYAFLSYNFLFKDLEYNQFENIGLNTEVFIHESGHLFGLDDYYDYDQGDSYHNTGGYSGPLMMENNIGDHDSYSKLILNWANAVVIDKSGTYTLPSFTDTGICYLIPTNKKHQFKGVFSEYYLLEFVTYKGLNALELPYYFGNPLNSYAGLKITLVSSELEDHGSFKLTKYNNSNTKYKLLRLMEKDYTNKGSFDIDRNLRGMDLNDLYQIGDTFGLGKYQNFKSPQGYNLDFTVKVKKMNHNDTTLEINFK